MYIYRLFELPYDMEITYREYQPSEALTPFVECYWMHSFDGPESEESPVQRCLPLGMLEVLFHVDDAIADILHEGKWIPLPRAFFHGIYNAPVYWKIRGSGRIFGIRFKPEAFAQLFGVPAASVFCKFVALESFFGPQVNPLPESIYGTENDIVVRNADAFIIQKAAHMQQCRNYIAEAASLIRSARGNISIAEVSNALSVSPRQLQRSFKDTMGTSPKSYMRIMRFRNALASISSEKEWADITYDLGYADQPHFIREFREFAGDAPKAVIRHAEQYFKKPERLTEKI